MATSNRVTYGLAAALSVAMGVLISQHNLLVSQSEQISADRYQIKSQRDQLQAQTERLQAQAENLPAAAISSQELPALIVYAARL